MYKELQVLITSRRTSNKTYIYIYTYTYIDTHQSETHKAPASTWRFMGPSNDL